MSFHRIGSKNQSQQRRVCANVNQGGKNRQIRKIGIAFGSNQTNAFAPTDGIDKCCTKSLIQFH
jgi:hypothetical protein